MTKRLAAVCALTVFAICLLLGMQARNTFTTTLTRALIAMAVTFAIGLVLGTMAQKMLEENLKTHEEKLKSSTQEATDGR